MNELEAKLEHEFVQILARYPQDFLEDHIQELWGAYWDALVLSLAKQKAP